MKYIVYNIEHYYHHLYSGPMVDETPTFVSKHRNLSQLNRYQGNVPQACAGKACGPSMPSMAVFMACDGGNHGKAVAELDDQHES